MYVTIVDGLARYYGADFNEACRILGERDADQNAHIFTVDSIDEAFRLTKLFAAVEKPKTEEIDLSKEKEFVAALNEIRDDDLLDQVGDVANKMQECVKDITGKIMKKVGDSLEKLGRDIKVNTDKP